jgi:UDP-N-acetylglucosamine 2-epimerase (non-hydrolysing)
MTSMPAEWNCPEGYLDTDVSKRVIKFLWGGGM